MKVPTTFGFRLQFHRLREDGPDPRNGPVEALSKLDGWCGRIEPGPVHFPFHLSVERLLVRVEINNF